MERCRARLRFHFEMKYLLVNLLFALPMAAAAAVVPFPRIPPYLPVPPGAAVIAKMGSTNAAGYRIVVQEDASAEYIAASGRATTVIPTILAQKFFADLAAVAPLPNLARVPCMKSASFGTSLFIYWNHGRSPDLSCPSDSRGRALLEDASSIAQALNISEGSFRRPVIRPMLPGERHKPLPSSTPM